MSKKGTPCTCASPFCVVLRDIVVRPVDNSQKVIVDRYCDCIFHGPFVMRLETYAIQYSYTNCDNETLIATSATYGPYYDTCNKYGINRRF